MQKVLFLWKKPLSKSTNRVWEKIPDLFPGETYVGNLLQKVMEGLVLKYMLKETSVERHTFWRRHPWKKVRKNPSQCGQEVPSNDIATGCAPSTSKPAYEWRERGVKCTLLAQPQKSRACVPNRRIQELLTLSPGALKSSPEVI